MSLMINWIAVKVASLEDILQAATYTQHGVRLLALCTCTHVMQIIFPRNDHSFSIDYLGEQITIFNTAIVKMVRKFLKYSSRECQQLQVVRKYVFLALVAAISFSKSSFNIDQVNLWLNLYRLLQPWIHVAAGKWLHFPPFCAKEVLVNKA